MLVRTTTAAAAALAALAVTTTSTVAVASSTTSNNNDFLKAMGAGVSIKKKTTNNSIKQQKLYKKLLSKATRRHGDDHQRRKLDEDDEEIEINLSQFSLKYNGCSTIKTYSDELAEDGDSKSVLKAQKFVVFRLCESSSCNKYSLNGCSSNYGEYMLPLAEYLKVMYEYNQQLEEEYCDFCEECYEQGYIWGGNGNNNNNAQQGDDAVQDQGDDAAVGDDAVANDDAVNRRKLQNNYNSNYDKCVQCVDNGWAQQCGYEQNNDEDNNEENDNERKNRRRRRKLADAEEDEEEEDEQEQGDDDGNDNNNNNNNNQWAAEYADPIDVGEYLECVQVEEDDDGNVYYVGPHCQSDGFQVTLGVYSDEFCSNYLGPVEYRVADQYFDQSFMSFAYPKECMSCADDKYWEFAEEEDDENNQEEDEEEEEVEINEVCEALYEESAKCHGNYDDERYSYIENSNNEQVCNYMKNVMSGQYNEYGEIDLYDDFYHFNVSNWQDKDEYIKEYNDVIRYSSKISPGLVLGLIVSASACVIMIIWSCFLCSALSKKNISWRPRRGKHAAGGYGGETVLSRQNSGIMLGRSQSGPGNDPLV